LNIDESLRYEILRTDGGKDIYGIKRKKILFGDE
jgi:hypothetical protein